MAGEAVAVKLFQPHHDAGTATMDSLHDNNWTRLLAYVTGLVNQELLLQNEYLAAEEPDPASTSANSITAHRPGEMHVS